MTAVTLSDAEHSRFYRVHGLRRLAVASSFLLPALGGAQATNSVVVHVRVGGVDGPIRDASVSSGHIAVLSDAGGMALLRLPPGVLTITARRIGFAPDSVTLTLAAVEDTTISLSLAERAATMTPVLVSSTRVERRVEDEPLRIEVLAGEDVAEKTQMHPADLRVLLTEMSGVRVQATSPSLGAASVRIQGMRGRYTQVLTDGLPLYGAQAGSFGLLQIPPLDLRQAEVVKGAASALYGPNAMGGVLNLISRRSSDSSEVLVNQTTRSGSDLVLFAAREVTDEVGATLLVGAHVQRAADTDGDGWRDIPGFRRLEVRPRFFASDSSGRSLMITAGAFEDDRNGGSTTIGDASAAFPESLSTRHADIGLLARTQVGSAFSVVVRAAVNIQDRVRRFGTQIESERASSAFAEIAASAVAGAHTLLGGIATQFERYRNHDVARFDEDRSTPAVFVQHTYAPLEWLAAQLNGRCDFSDSYGTVCTPRVSVLAHAGKALSARLSGAGGWAAPRALTEDTEVVGLTHVAGPLVADAEHARTAALDVSGARGPLEISGTVFASRVANPVGLKRISADVAGAVTFVNAAGPALAHGAELFVLYNQEPLIITAYYAATRTRDTSPEDGRVRESPYVPRETAGFDLAFEEDESGTRIGIEAFYTGAQALDENPYRSVAPAFTTVGVLASQQLGRATLYVNLENLTGVQQRHYDPLLRPSPGEAGRRTVDAWAPLEGRALNAGVRWRL